MGTLYKIQSELLADGVISPCELEKIEDYIHANGSLDLADIKLLVELQSQARAVCPQFEDLLYPTLKQVLLADGQVTLDEQYYLLKMLCHDGQVGEREQKLLKELRAESRTRSPEFEQFVDQALSGAL
jgi:hypothetical protein